MICIYWIILNTQRMYFFLNIEIYTSYIHMRFQHITGKIEYIKFEQYGWINNYASAKLKKNKAALY